jgi:hypothetical protein
MVWMVECQPWRPPSYGRIVAGEESLRSEFVAAADPVVPVPDRLLGLRVCGDAF